MTEPYQPSEDTFLVEEMLRRTKFSGFVAEVGCSTGYLTEVLAATAAEVVSTDVNISALEEARNRLRPYIGKIHLVNAERLPLREGVLDAAVSNPPYLPDDEAFKDPSIHGGPQGIEAALTILSDIYDVLKAGGVAVLTASSLSNPKALLNRAEEMGFKLVEASTLKLFFEKVFCFKFMKKPHGQGFGIGEERGRVQA